MKTKAWFQLEQMMKDAQEKRCRICGLSNVYGCTGEKEELF